VADRLKQNSWWVGILGAVLAILAITMPADAGEKYTRLSGQWETAAPGANTDLLTSDVTWTQWSSMLRLTITCDTSTVVNLMVSRGGTENALGMNANAAVAAGGTYVWDVPGLEPGDVINVQVETDSAIPHVAIGIVTGSR